MPNNRKCSYCGREDVYAKGLCKNCYARQLRNGAVGYKGNLKGPRSKNAIKTLELYRKGMKQTDIARELGITQASVSLTIKRYSDSVRADRIRSMSDEKLAEFLCGIETAATYYGPLGNKDAWLVWLRKE